jgi:NADH:ubiquinone oxidoreductase subunit 5 (subunit L)/multisubunit Na+/H+ antiporter MnhA subunit
LGAAIFVLPKNYILSDIEFIDLFHKLLPLIISLIGAFFAYFLYSFNLKKFYFIKKNRYFKIFYNFLNKKWYFDRLYNQFLAQNVISMSYKHTYQNLDRGIIEKFGPWGIVNIVISIFTELKRVGFDSWISIEDGVDGMDQLERSVAFLRKKIPTYWP